MGGGTDVQERNGGGFDHAGSEGEKGAQDTFWGSDYTRSGYLPTEGERGLG